MMDHYSLDDIQLQTLATRLGDIVPKVSAAEQQQLLYECAFAAGQRAAKRVVRRWQGAAAVLTVLLMGASIPLARERSAPEQAIAVQPAQNRGLERTAADDEIPPIPVRGANAILLDAWQTKPSTVASFDSELAQFARMDPHLRSLAVGALTHQILEQ
jgi:hypothetical protein